MPLKYDLTVSPTADGDVPDGDGYYLHDSLFASQHSQPDTLSVSMLMDGPFRSGTERHTKRVLADESYRVRLAVTDADEHERLVNSVSPYVEGDETFALNDTEFEVIDHERTETTLEALWDEATAHADAHPEVLVEFNTPTCVVHPRSTVTEMFPHRRSIFPQLAAAWNRALETNSVSDNLKLALDPFDVGAQVFEKPQAESYRTYSTLTDIRENADGEETPFFRQGYIGTCSYGFRNADDPVVKTVIALALFAEYNGIGADTNHGCGCVTTTVDGGRR